MEEFYKSFYGVSSRSWKGKSHGWVFNNRRDVYHCVASTYHELFHSMEALGVLNADDDIDLFVLQSLALTRIFGTGTLYVRRIIGPHTRYGSKVLYAVIIKNQHCLTWMILGSMKNGHYQQNKCSLLKIKKMIYKQHAYLNCLSGRLTLPVVNNETDYCREFIQAKSLLLQLLQ